MVDVKFQSAKQITIYFTKKESVWNLKVGEKVPKV